MAVEENRACIYKESILRSLKRTNKQTPESQAQVWEGNPIRQGFSGAPSPVAYGANTPVSGGAVGCI